MQSIPDTVQEIIRTRRSCVLSVESKDGVHSAAMLYSHSSDYASLYFQSESSTEKMSLIQDVLVSRAAVVIGTTEEEKITLQLRGKIRLISDLTELKSVKDIHYAKHPLSQPYESDKTVFLEFIHDWYRLTDYRVKPPQLTHSS